MNYYNYETYSVNFFVVTFSTKKLFTAFWLAAWLKTNTIMTFLYK